MVQIRIKKGQPYPLGATVKSSGINFSMVNSSDEECGLILYHKESCEIQRLVFEKNIELVIFHVFLWKGFV